MPRLLIVDDNTTLGEGLKAIVAFPWIVEIVSSAQSARKKLAEHEHWDAVLLDVKLGDGNGLDVLEWARPYHPGTWWMVMTSSGEKSIVRRAANLGAAFVPKPFRARKLQLWLDSVLLRSDRTPWDFVLGAENVGEEKVRQALRRFQQSHKLTAGELRVVQSALEAFSRPEIAQDLDISLHTYQKYATAIKKKTGSSVSQAAIRVLRWAIMGPES